jgi:hypothetical protein
MKQSSLGLLDFLGVPISPLLLSTDNSQFTIRVNSTKVVQEGKKKGSLSPGNCFLKSPYLDILLYVACPLNV